jgi:putative transposase
VVNRPIYLAMGVTVDGERDILGLWAGEHGDGEGAKFWLRVLAEIKNRGVRDVLMLVCDGLKGLPDAVNTVWDKTIVQACVVHLLRNSFKYTSKRDWPELAKDLKPIYTAPSADAALDRFAEFSDSGRSPAPQSFDCGRTRGRSSCRSLSSTSRSARSSAPQMLSNRSTRACAVRSVPAGTSRPSRLR